MRKNCSGQFFLLPNRIFDEWLIFIKKNKKLQTAKNIYSSNITFNIIISNFGSKHFIAGRTYCIVPRIQTTPF